MPESERPQETPERWIQAGFQALAAHLVILDARGTIRAVNAAWEQFARTHRASPMVEAGLGLNYLEVCQRAAAAGSPEAQDALLGLQAVLQGRQAAFTMGYPCPAPGHP